MANAARRLRVLVVDDERIIADTLTLIIQREGHSVRAAYGGTAAIDIAEEFTPDLLISDVVMPDPNGIAVADRFLELCPECKVILMSGNSESRALLNFAAAHGKNYAFLQKPFHPREVLALLNRVENLE